MGSASEGTMTHRHADQAHADSWACPKRERLGAGVAHSDQCSLPRNPVESAALRLHETVSRNEVTAGVLSEVVDLRSRCPPHATRRRIPQEAKAWGNAQDRLTWGRSPEGVRDQ
jgi:hypothetical protein